MAWRTYIILLMTFLLSSCQSSQFRSIGAGLDETDQALFGSWQTLSEKFNCCANQIWDASYLPQNEPILFVRTERGFFQYAYLLNHPNARNIPGAQQITTAALQNLGPIYRINSLSQDQLDYIGNFDFTFPLGGIDIFAVTYQRRTADKVLAAQNNLDEYQNPGQPVFEDVKSEDWILFLAHEIFHRRQIKNWAELTNDQDLTTYNFSLENIALALLEQSILKQAVQRNDVQIARSALIEYAAVRAYRQSRFGLQIKTLDGAQETLEGTTRYIEHGFGEILGSRNVDLNNFHQQIELDEEINSEFDSKRYFGFGRFYATGAAVASLLDRAQIPWKSRVRNGEDFADIIDQRFGRKNYQQVVEGALKRYDYPRLVNRAAQYQRYLR